MGKSGRSAKLSVEKSTAGRGRGSERNTGPGSHRHTLVDLPSSNDSVGTTSKTGLTRTCR